MKNNCFLDVIGPGGGPFFVSGFSDTGLCMAEEPAETVEAASEEGEPLSEGSGIVTRDLLYDKATNKQFLTISGPGREYLLPGD